VDEEMLMLWAAHSLVRVADYVVSICERTIFLTTGELKEFN
jgi:phosphate uptake regulator